MIEKQLESFLDSFDREWHFAATPPSIISYVEQAASLRFDLQQSTSELVRIDAEYRWRSPTRARLLPLQENIDGANPERQHYALTLGLTGDLSWLDDEIEMLRGRFGSDTKIDNAGRASTIVVDSLHPADHRELTLSPCILPSVDDRYLPIRHLGSGAFGDVWLVKDRILDRFVAVKTMRTDHLSSTAISRLVYESRMVAAVKHSQIPMIYDVFTSDRGVHFVMEYIEGTPMDSWNVGRSLEERLSVIADVAEAVHSAHVAGLIHCDIKPSNVLINSKGRGWLIDFGLAVQEHQQSNLKNTMFGTPAFLSPEQVRGESHRLDGRTDVWSIGVLLYWAMSDRLPFQGDSQAALFEEIEFRHAKPLRQINDQIPREIEAICLRCLEQRPPDRYATAGDVATEIRAALQTFAVKPIDLSQAVAITKRRRLPPERNSIVGRETIVAEIIQLFRSRQSRLVTLTGPGGIGKTRLALAVGRQMQDSSATSVYWIDLASARTGSDICEAVRLSLDLPAPSGHESSEALLESLSLLGPLLLVLDNLEQALAAVPETIGFWTRFESDLQILATSQRRLRVVAERVIRLHPLSLPNDASADESLGTMKELIATSEALKLFADRAVQAASPLDDSAETRRAAIEICRRLDGLPLAIELAAARLPVLGPQGVARKLLSSLAFLRSQCDDTPERQQTLYATISWSLDLLSEQEQHSLQALAQWPASMPTELCERVVDFTIVGDVDSIDILQELQDRNFLISEENDGVAWLEIPFTVRSFLKQTAYFETPEPAREGLVLIFGFWSSQHRFGLNSAFAEAASENLWLASELACKLDDHRLAAESAILADAFASGHIASKRRVERLLSINKQLAKRHCAFHLALADAYKSAADYQTAITLASEAVAMAEANQLRVAAMRCLAEAWYELGDYEKAGLEADQALTVSRHSGDSDSIAALLAVKGRIAWRTGSFNEAIAWIEEAMSQSTPRTSPSLIGELIRDKGNVLLMQGRADQSIAFFVDAEQWAQKSRDIRAIFQAKLSRAAATAECGRYAEAIELYAAAESLCRRLGDIRGLAKVLNNRALALIDIGEPSKSLQLLDHAIRLNRQCRHQTGMVISLSALGTAFLALDDARKALQYLDEAFEKIGCVAGSWHDAIVRRDRGVALMSVGERESAIRMLCQALELLQNLDGSTSVDAFLVYVALATSGHSDSTNHIAKAEQIAKQHRLSHDHPRKRLAESLVELEKLRRSAKKVLESEDV